MAIKNTVSIDFLSTFLERIGVFYCCLPGVSILIHYQGHKTMERGGSVLECLTRDCGVAGSRLTEGTASCP